MPETRRRGRETAGDLLRSLALVVVFVAVALALSARDHDGSQVKVVDFTEALAQARDTAPYAVLAPSGLSGEWRPTSARTTPEADAVVWHLGFVTPREAFAGLDQSDGSSQEFVSRFADGARPAGTQGIGQLAWQRLEGGEPEERALVLHRGGVTTVVAGSASWEELVELARSLHPA